LSLHVYAAVVKNLRGVLYCSTSHEIFLDKLSWLKRRFRYRNLGLPPCVLERYGGVMRGSTSPKILELRAPLEGLEELIRAYSDLLDLSPCALEAYCFASIYVAPLMVLGEGSVEDLSPIAIGEVPIERELTDKEYKLHFRIADYTVLDFYLWATSSAQEALRAFSMGEDIEDKLREREERVEKDRKRYWRIISEQGRPFVLYLDLLPTLVAKLNPGRARELLERYGSLIPATLAIISAVVI